MVEDMWPRTVKYENLKPTGPTGFGYTQCPVCGSTAFGVEARKKTPGEARGVGTECDIVSYRQCGDCGWKGEA